MLGLKHSITKMVVFTKQYSLQDRMANDILQIAKFGFVAWEFLSAVYKSRWEKLTANKDNRSFRQCVSL